MEPPDVNPHREEVARRARLAPGASPLRFAWRRMDHQMDAIRPRVKTPYETAAALIAKLTRTEITVPVQCELVGRTAVRVSLDPEIIRADEPRVLGGGGTASTPSQYALAALGSSTAITFAYWSDRLGIPIDLLRVDVQGDIDLRGFVGLGEDVRPGFCAAAMKVTISGPASVAQYEELQRVVDGHSPVLDLFTNRVPVKTTIAVV